MPGKPRKPMPKFTKAPAELVARFRALTASLPGAEARTMFSYPAAFIKGNMFAGLFQDRMFLRLSEADRAEFGALPGAAPFEVMPGRPMREYMLVPHDLLATAGRLNPWLKRSMAFAAALPTRTKRSRTS